MKFWDSSAVVPLLIEERTTSSLLAIYQDDPAVVVWWGTKVECAAAVARLERDGKLTIAAVAEAFAHLKALSQTWHEIQPVEELRESAIRFFEGAQPASS